MKKKEKIVFIIGNIFPISCLEEEEEEEEEEGEEIQIWF
jgi:hypothetical protein